MAGQGKGWGRREHDAPDPAQEPHFYLLDRFTAANIRSWEARKDEITAFHWEFFQALAGQRRQSSSELNAALLEAARGPFTFAKWQRVVALRYSVEPLSLKGSVSSDTGGRFNLGAVDPINFPPFPALYLAANKETAYQEYLCSPLPPSEALSAFDYALQDPTSLANVSMTGRLDRVIDLRSPSRLEAFCRVLGRFELPIHVLRSARRLGVPKPRLVRNVDQLMRTLQ